MTKIEVYKLSRWLCGLWAFGLGLRMSIELFACSGWVHVPKHPLNIYFDFLPLCVFGLVVSMVETRRMCRIYRRTSQ